MRICNIPKCGREHKARGFCVVHYERWKKYKDPYMRKCNANGEGCIDQFGYKLISINGKQVREHRVIMETHIGRKLLPHPFEVVHHKDGNKLNNSIDNLEIHTQGNHTILHLKKSFIKNGMRNCTKCSLTFPLKRFSKDNTSKAAYKPYCKSCQNESNKKIISHIHK